MEIKSLDSFKPRTPNTVSTTCKMVWIYTFDWDDILTKMRLIIIGISIRLGSLWPRLMLVELVIPGIDYCLRSEWADGNWQIQARNKTQFVGRAKRIYGSGFHH